jgi:hypothetical protein
MRHARADYDARIQDSAGLIPDDEPVLADEAERGYAFPAAWVSPAGRVVTNEQRAAFGDLDEQVAGSAEWRPLYLLPKVVDAEIVEEMHRHVMKGGFWLVHDHFEGLAPHGHSYVGMFQGESGCGPESWRSLMADTGA